MEVTLALSYIVLEGNSCISKDKGTSLSNFVPNSGRKHLQLHINRRMCCQLRWMRSVINWRRLSVASLSQWASTMCVTQHIARVCRLWQLILVKIVSLRTRP